jgi:hypothetical protein
MGNTELAPTLKRTGYVTVDNSNNSNNRLSVNGVLPNTLHKIWKFVNVKEGISKTSKGKQFFKHATF